MVSDDQNRSSDIHALGGKGQAEEGMRQFATRAELNAEPRTAQFVMDRWCAFLESGADPADVILLWVFMPAREDLSPCGAKMFQVAAVDDLVAANYEFKEPLGNYIAAPAVVCVCEHMGKIIE